MASKEGLGSRQRHVLREMREDDGIMVITRSKMTITAEVLESLTQRGLVQQIGTKDSTLAYFALTRAGRKAAAQLDGAR